MSCEREQAATPTFERLDVNWEELNESAISGYEGDKEDEGESYMEGGMKFINQPKNKFLLFC